MKVLRNKVKRNFMIQAREMREKTRTRKKLSEDYMKEEDKEAEE